MSETPNLIKIKVIGTTGISYNIPIEKSQNINIRKLKEIIQKDVVFQLMCLIYH